jgi:hypothetical protein
MQKPDQIEEASTVVGVLKCPRGSDAFDFGAKVTFYLGHRVLQGIRRHAVDLDAVKVAFGRDVLDLGRELLAVHPIENLRLHGRAVPRDGKRLEIEPRNPVMAACGHANLWTKPAIPEADHGSWTV